MFQQNDIIMRAPSALDLLGNDLRKALQRHGLFSSDGRLVPAIKPRPMQHVIEQESIYRTEVRCWIAKSLKHYHGVFLGADVLPRAAVTEVLPLHMAPRLLAEGELLHTIVGVDGPRLVACEYEPRRSVLVLQDGRYVVQNDLTVEVGDELHVLDDGTAIGYASEVRAERWFDPRTAEMHTFHVTGSEVDVSMALCVEDGRVVGTTVICPVRGKLFAHRRGLIPVSLGNAWGHSPRGVVSPGDVLPLSSLEAGEFLGHLQED